MVYDHAREIWIGDSIRKHYILHENPKTLAQLPEYDPDGLWLDNDKLGEQFRDKFGEVPPSKRYPPYGGTAVYCFDHNNNCIQELGWRKWHCQFVTPIHFQEFEHGMMVGVLPESKDEKNQKGLIFTLIYNSDWHQDNALSGDVPAQCDPGAHPRLNEP